MTGRPLRIAIGVHGRFYAFDLARALIARGHDVTVFTNYPARIVARFGLPPERVRSFVAHGVASRAAAAVAARTGGPTPEAFLHRAFGRWLARSVRRETWDVVHVFSGIAEETIEALAGRVTPVTVVRASAHIRVQDRLLDEEAERTGLPVERPSPWMIRREEREYATASAVCVLSRFAERTFLETGHPAARLRRYTLGVEAEAFAASPETAAAREARIRRGGPLRVLYVGAKSAQKGMADFSEVARRLSGERFVFRAVGPDGPEAAAFRSGTFDSRPKVPQDQLANEYAWGDVFLFPTIQDGFPVVVAQAAMNGLPVLTTENCGAADLLVEGESGWIIPIRRPDLIAARLQALDADREALARTARHVYETARPPSWDDAAEGFEQAAMLTQPGRAAAADSSPDLHRV